MREKMTNKKIVSSLMLILTALIWGAAFVAQSVGMDYIGPYTFNAARFAIGGIVLIPCIFLLPKLNKSRAAPAGISAGQRKLAVIGGICCGLCLAVASTLQQLGILYSDSVGKVGFMTSLYIILVPILGIFLGKKAGINIWLSVLISAAGMYLLGMTEDLVIDSGDFFTLLCALGFAVHIMVIDYFSPRTDSVVISCIQFFVAALVSAVLMLLFETPTLTSLLAAWAPVLYAGIFSCGVAYTLQVVAQKHIEPTVASLIMSLESVFSLFMGWAILGQRLSVKELIGCALVFVAIVLAQVPVKKNP